MSQKTYSAKPTDVTRQWLLLDAADAPLGRVATQAARYLCGKHKSQYTPHIDCGDYVVIVNAAQLKVTGAKAETKTYYRHSGHPGNLKSTTLREQAEKDPTRIVVNAVAGMLPKNKLQSERLKRLKVYVDETHDHEAQKPVKVEVN